MVAWALWVVVMQSILRIEQRRSISLVSLLTFELTAPREMLRCALHDSDS